jgi:putative holliday junction resolvase
VSRILGIDFGHRRVGVAVSDPLGLTAQPLEVIAGGNAVERIKELVSEYEVDLLVVGVPNPLSGGESASSRLARDFAVELEEETGLEVVLADERFTSRMAEQALLDSGMRRRQRREKIDKVAAAIILQAFLDGNFRTSGDVEEVGPP